MTQLDEIQTEIVNYDGDATHVQATPGSGKTRTIIEKMRRMIGLGSHVLAITFTKKAANEMMDRLSTNQIDNKVKKPLLGTFHMVACRFLRQYGGKDFSIVDSVDQKTIIKMILDNTKSCNNSNKMISSCLGMISTLKNRPGEPVPGAPENLDEIYASYQDALHENNSLDFDDLIIECTKLLNATHKNIHPYDYLMVDEFQDTNDLQWEMIKALNIKKIFVVGDSDQMIYTWRHASSRNIDNLHIMYPIRTFKMTNNYRSNSKIIEVAHSIIEQPTREPKHMTSHVDVTHRNPVICRVLDTHDNEVESICRCIMGTPHKTRAILLRMYWQSRAFEARLKELGVPFKLLNGIAFYERPPVKILLSMLRLKCNPLDGIALRYAINKPSRGIGEKTLEKIMLSIKSNTQKPKKYRDFLKIIDGIIFEDAHRSLVYLKDIIKLDEYLINEYPSLEEYHQQVKCVEELLLISKGRSVKEFLTMITLESDAIRDAIDDSDDDSVDDNEINVRPPVIISTLHSAKGLEWDMVVIPSVEENIIPHIYAVGESYEEERRLFYVGVTRARQQLMLTRAKSRDNIYEIRKNLPSPFYLF
uniref:DNA 3'-5' helicase n=1 Tax=Megaviridae environmental sample TaxID=1737588 RepID=A0A5J6VIJ8_9VIRU|nr:MAG: UvrD-like helicase C-terminal domain protein [Megaviridae environmental sample]